MTANSAIATDDPDTEAECRLLEAAVAEARADSRPSVPHDEVRIEMLRDIERLNRRIAAITKP